MIAQRHNGFRIAETVEVLYSNSCSTVLYQYCNGYSVSLLYGPIMRVVATTAVSNTEQKECLLISYEQWKVFRGHMNNGRTSTTVEARCDANSIVGTHSLSTVCSEQK